MSLHAIQEDVVFDHAGAAELAERFRATAAELERQSGGERGLRAMAARAEWRGRFAEEFDQRVRQCCTDGRELAAAFRRAAAGLEELSAAATREQRRREQARAWEAASQRSGFLGRIVDNVSDFFLGEDDVPPPPPPEPEPRVLVAACTTGTRGC